MDKWLLGKLNFMRKHSVMCDLTLKSDDNTIVAIHKVVWLAAFVDEVTLKTQFNNIKDVRSQALLVPYMSGKMLKTIVDFIYGEEVKVKPIGFRENLERLGFMFLDDIDLKQNQSTDRLENRNAEGKPKEITVREAQGYENHGMETYCKTEPIDEGGVTSMQYGNIDDEESDKWYESKSKAQDKHKDSNNLRQVVEFSNIQCKTEPLDEQFESDTAISNQNQENTELFSEENVNHRCGDEDVSSMIVKTEPLSLSDDEHDELEKQMAMDQCIQRSADTVPCVSQTSDTETDSHKSAYSHTKEGSSSSNQEKTSSKEKGKGRKGTNSKHSGNGKFLQQENMHAKSKEILPKFSQSSENTQIKTLAVFSSLPSFKTTPHSKLPVFETSLIPVITPSKLTNLDQPPVRLDNFLHVLNQCAGEKTNSGVKSPTSSQPVQEPSTEMSNPMRNNPSVQSLHGHPDNTELMSNPGATQGLGSKSRAVSNLEDGESSLKHSDDKLQNSSPKCVTVHGNCNTRNAISCSLVPVSCHSADPTISESSVPSVMMNQPNYKSPNNNLPIPNDLKSLPVEKAKMTVKNEFCHPSTISAVSTCVSTPTFGNVGPEYHPTMRKHSATATASSATTTLTVAQAAQNEYNLPSAGNQALMSLSTAAGSGQNMVSSTLVPQSVSGIRASLVASSSKTAPAMSTFVISQGAVGHQQLLTTGNHAMSQTVQSNTVSNVPVRHMGPSGIQIRPLNPSTLQTIGLSRLPVVQNVVQQNPMTITSVSPSTSLSPVGPYQVRPLFTAGVNNLSINQPQLLPFSPTIVPYSQPQMFQIPQNAIIPMGLSHPQPLPVSHGNQSGQSQVIQIPQNTTGQAQSLQTQMSSTTVSSHNQTHPGHKLQIVQSASASQVPTSVSAIARKRVNSSLVAKSRQGRRPNHSYKRPTGPVKLREIMPKPSADAHLSSPPNNVTSLDVNMSVLEFPAEETRSSAESKSLTETPTRLYVSPPKNQYFLYDTEDNRKQGTSKGSFSLSSSTNTQLCPEPFHKKRKYTRKKDRSLINLKPQGSIAVKKQKRRGRPTCGKGAKDSESHQTLSKTSYKEETQEGKDVPVKNSKETIISGESHTSTGASHTEETIQNFIGNYGGDKRKKIKMVNTQCVSRKYKKPFPCTASPDDPTKRSHGESESNVNVKVEVTPDSNVVTVFLDTDDLDASTPDVSEEERHTGTKKPNHQRKRSSGRRVDHAYTVQDSPLKFHHILPKDFIK